MKNLLNIFSSIACMYYQRILLLVFIIFVAISTLNAQPVLPNNNEDKGKGSDWTFLKEFVPTYNRVWFTTPLVDDANTVYAPVMGNGDMNACISGDDNTQIYYMRTADFWTDDGLKEHNVHEIPAGCLKISFDKLNKGGGQSVVGDDGIKYRQEEDMLNAEIRTILSFSGYGLKLTSYVAATENTLVVELSSDSPKAIGVSVELNTDVLDRVAYPSTAGVEGDKLFLTRETSNREGARWISRAAFATRIFGASHVVYYTDEGDNPRSRATFELPAHTTVKIVTCLNGGKNVTTHLETAKKQVSNFTNSTFTTLKNNHRNWWKSNWWLKSYVRTYDEIMDKYYYRALYQLGTMCREGYVNSGLHGPWKASDTKHNYSSFCSNDLGAASYYLPLIVSNRASTAKMWIETANDWIPEGRRRAITDAGLTKGIYFPVHWTPWGSTYEFYYWGQKYCAPFVSLVGNWYYKFTEDIPYLKERVYPFMKECGDFYEEWLKKESDGKYHVKAASYENESDDYMNSCMELLQAKIIFTDLIKYSEVLGIDSDRRAKWQDIRDNLNDFSTTTYNGKTVYKADATTKFDHSVNVIQTHIVYPGYTCNRFSDPEIRKLGYNTIEQAANVGGWNQDNMRGQGRYVAALRIGGFNVADLISHFKEMLALRTIDYPVYIADAGLWEFNNQLCLQSYDEGVMFFPDYPKDKIASFKRLRAPGAFLCSGEFKDGKATDLRVFSEMGNSFTFMNPWDRNREVEVKEENGALVPIKQIGDKYTFSTVVGKAYRIIQANH